MKSPCFICGCDKPVDKGITVAGYSLMECPECALQSLHPFPDEKRLKSIYSDYYKSWGSPRSLEKVSKMKAETFRSYLDIISPPAGHGRLLDIGCATGDLLEAARGSGFDVYGAEVSEEGFFQSRQKIGGDRVLHGSLKPGDFNDNFFDIITVFDVLEHIASPIEFLGVVSDILKPSGRLMIVTPDTSSWTRKIMGRRWPHYKEEHIFYYNRDNITRLLSGCFDVLDIKAARKTLSIDYVKNVMNYYGDKGFVSLTVNFIAKTADRFKFAHFKMCIGEMLILCRKHDNCFV